MAKEKEEKQKTKFIALAVAAAAVAVPVVGFAAACIGQNHNSYAEGQSAAEAFQYLVKAEGLGAQATTQAANVQAAAADIPNEDIWPFTNVDFAKCVDGAYSRGHEGKSLPWSEGEAVMDKALSDIYTLECRDIDLSQTGSLTGLDHMSNLGTVVLSHDKLSQIDLSSLGELDSLDLSHNQLTEINLSNNKALESVLLNDNSLTSLDLSNNSKLILLGVWNNQLTNLDVSNMEDLFLLGAWNNQFKSMNLVNVPELRLLAIDNILVKTEIVTNQTAGAKDFDLNKLSYIGPLNLDFSNDDEEVFPAGMTFIESPYYNFNLSSKILAVNDLEGAGGSAQVVPYCSNDEICNKTIKIEDLEITLNQILQKLPLKYSLQLTDGVNPDVPKTDDIKAPNTGFRAATTIVTATSIAAPTLIASLLVTRALRNRKRGHIKFD